MDEMAPFTGKWNDSMAGNLHVPSYTRTSSSAADCPSDTQNATVRRLLAQVRT